MGGESEVVGGTERLFQRLSFHSPWSALPAGSLHLKRLPEEGLRRFSLSGLAEWARP